MAGYRLGYLAARKDIVKAVSKLQSQCLGLAIRDPDERFLQFWIRGLRLLPSQALFVLGKRFAATTILFLFQKH